MKYIVKIKNKNTGYNTLTCGGSTVQSHDGDIISRSEVDKIM